MRKLVSLLLVLALVLMAAGSLFAAATTEEPEEDGPFLFSHATGPWDVSNGRISVDEQPDDVWFSYVRDTVGIAPLTQSWEWEGSRGYVQGLRLALAGGEAFESIMPWDPALVQELVDAGQAVALDELLPQYAPTAYSVYTEEEWANIATQQGGAIYAFPQPSPTVTIRAGFIRKDWLERVGLDVPTTQDELLEVYRAFQAQDANGNGDPNDEIPVSGRELFRWFDDLYNMYGVAMYEGHPQWTYSEEKGLFESEQVSDQMFEALKWIRSLYEEGLMDVTMPAQPNADWTAKLNDNRIGHYFHLINEIPNKSAFAFQDGGDPTGESHWSVLPHPPIVEGYGQQMYTFPRVGDPRFMILDNARSPERILELVEWSSGREGQIYNSLGIEGVNYEVVDGQFVATDSPAPARYKFAPGFGDAPDELIANTAFGAMKLEFMAATRDNVMNPANMFMPNSVYDGYTDFVPNASTMYREIAGQIITGQVPATKATWDAYVEDWYAAGGQVVTDRANEWYDSFFGN